MEIPETLIFKPRNLLKPLQAIWLVEDLTPINPFDEITLSLLMHVFYRSLVFSCLSAYFCLNLAGEDEGFLFFEKIRPVFAQHCYECHSAKSGKLKANLLLDRKEGWIQGGDSGPAINPGKPENSMLMKAIGYHDNDLRMPPKRKLPVEAIRDIENWIAWSSGSEKRTDW